MHNYDLFQSGMGPDSMGQAYQAYGGERSNFTYIDRMQQQKNVEEAEDLDVNASLHGNWTMENAKSKLHQFMQLNKIHAEYIYKAVGPDHTKLVYFHGLSSSDDELYSKRICKHELGIKHSFLTVFQLEKSMLESQQSSALFNTGLSLCCIDFAALEFGKPSEPLCTCQVFKVLLKIWSLGRTLIT